jgi:hypothetical protein
MSTSSITFAFFTAAFCGSLASATSIPVINHSFEATAWSPCSFGGPVPGWTAGGSWGSWNPGQGDECFWYGFDESVPDGVQVAFTNSPNGPISQVVNATLQPNTKYTLAVDVGRRSDCCAMEDYKIQLLAGGVVLTEDNDILDPAPGTFQTSIICVNVDRFHESLGQPLEIRLFLIGGTQAEFDNVRLESGPVGGDCTIATGILGDIDNSGAVDGADLGLLLGSWGDCPDCNDCPADVNDDCTVDGADLGILLGNWS